MYRLLSSSLQNFKKELFRYTTAYTVQSPDVIVGDFNTDIRKILILFVVGA